MPSTPLWYLSIHWELKLDTSSIFRDHWFYIYLKVNLVHFKLFLLEISSMSLNSSQPISLKSSLLLDFGPFSPQSSWYVIQISLFLHFHPFHAFWALVFWIFRDFWGSVYFACFGLWVVLIHYSIVMHCILLLNTSIFLHSLGLCDWLCWVLQFGIGFYPN